MTQRMNKTALQEAIYELNKNGAYSHPQEILVFKAAQSYADLPEKIEARKRTIDKTEELHRRWGDCCVNTELDEILNLLREGV